jgi:hypothetical protein
MEAGARSDAAATAKIQHPNYLGNALNNKAVDATDTPIKLHLQIDQA